MTNEHTLGGTTLVNPASSTDLKHSLRSVNHPLANAHYDEEATLIKEEEKIVDEEITSVESALEHDKVEDAMFAVALANSVVDNHSATTGDQSANTEPHGDSLLFRSGLRKRRRPSGQNLERLDNSEASSGGDYAHPLIKREDTSMYSSSATGPAHLPSITSSTGIRHHTQHKFPKLEETELSSYPSTSSVPNPLSQPLQPPPPPPTILQPSNQTTDEPATNSATLESLPLTVPCPLPAAAFVPEVSTAEPTVDVTVVENKQVTFHEDISFADASAVNDAPAGRSRAFSIDIDLALEFPDDSSGAGAEDLVLAGGGRNRAYSFECFAFGINADEPLPPLEQSSSNAQAAKHPGRPRGDSIIFDPSSFQDGGIHEQNALEKARSADLSVDPLPAVSNTPIVPPTDQVPSIIQSSSVPTTSTFTAQSPVTTAMKATVPAATVSGSTISFELLNKDGRIGIYLPDARRARIARFHAKRAKRIWRKRIKYDCRKKLADSRPRIKGRFVKRSDVDED